MQVARLALRALIVGAALLTSACSQTPTFDNTGGASSSGTHSGTGSSSAHGGSSGTSMADCKTCSTNAEEKSCKAELAACDSECQSILACTLKAPSQVEMCA